MPETYTKNAWYWVISGGAWNFAAYIGNGEFKTMNSTYLRPFLAVHVKEFDGELGSIK